MSAPQEVQAAPGPLNGRVRLREDDPLGAPDGVFVIRPQLGSAEQVVDTLERLFRALQARRVGLSEARGLTNICRAAAELYRERAPIRKQAVGVRGGQAVERAQARAAVPVDELVQAAPDVPAELSFEERVEAARLAEANTPR